MSAPSTRINVLAAVSATVAGIVGLVACAPDEVHTSTHTLAPVQTTSTTAPVTTAPATTIPPYYEVQRNDTLMAIATAFGLPVEVIMDYNGIRDRNAIRVGQILLLPQPEMVARELPPTVPGQTAPTIPQPVLTTTTDPLALPVIQTTRPTLPLPPPLPTTTIPG